MKNFNCTTTELSQLFNQTLIDVYCSSCDSSNPWCGHYNWQRFFEIFYLTFVAILGTFGNIIVICSINHAKRLYKHGNVFVVNLAIVDLVLTGFYIPTAIPNIIKTQQAFKGAFCDVTGFLVFLTCTCSIANLALISLNRYLSILYSSLYAKIFSKKRMLYFAIATWLWSFALGIPILTGWSGIRYDPKMMLCTWDDEKSKSYNFFATIFAILIPVIVTSVCYALLFRNVRQKRLMTSRSRITSNSMKGPTSKEMSLLRTLAITVLIFVLCWMPYGATILIDPYTVSPLLKKAFGWIGLTNSCMNFLIYGLMNPVYRRDYIRLMKCIFCRRTKGLTYSSSSDFTSTQRRRRKSKGTTQSLTTQGSVKSNTLMLINRQVVKTDADS